MDTGNSKEVGVNQMVRQFNNSLWFRDDNGDGHLAVPEFEYDRFDPDSDEARLLVLHPTDNVANHVRCDLETHLVTKLPPFVAIKNARGYRNMREFIEVNGKALSISVALERFLRYFRTTIKEPSRIWVRYACVREFDQEEQSRYWTRDFSDNMYAMASGSFDMHEINSRLIVSGYFERIIDSRYKTWRKEWYGVPGEVTLPRVCPIRLGTKPDNDKPTYEYEYMPLDMVTDEIRVMCLMPAEDVSAPIIMHAAHCPIKCEVHFSALSYRWGADETTEEVVLNGRKKLIRKNLAEAIRAIRMTEKIIPVWIDAMSINQNDTIERGRQVPRMGNIYDNAIVVFSYVGEQTHDTVAALDFVEQLWKQPMVRINDHGEFHFGEWGSTEGSIWYGENTIKPDKLAELCAALYNFLTRQYFRRAWILQEVAWASNPTIVAGNKLQVKFDFLDMAAYNFLDMLQSDPSLAGRMREADPSIEKVDVDMLAFPRKLFYFRHVVSGGERYMSLLPFATIKKTSPGFLEALILARDFECTDPRDHIFALWDLARDKSGLDYTPDYIKSYEDVYIDFTRSWIAQHGMLDILGAVEATPHSHAFYEKAPSWCPNWNTPATSSCLVRKDYIPPRNMFVVNDLDGELYSTDGGMNRDSFDSPLFSFKGNILSCTGLIIDQIKLIFDDAPTIPVGTGFPRCDPESNWRFRCWTEEIDNHYKQHELTTYDDPLRAAWAMLHGDNIAAWPPPQESGYDPTTYHPNEQYVCVTQLSRHVLFYGQSYDRTAAWGVVKTVLRGRRPFISESGYMGLAPAHITEMDSSERPWLLAIVAGCSVPLLLRERDDGTYQLYGTCFVQGWMDGEFMEIMMGAENPREFWETIRDGAKLEIS